VTSTGSKRGRGRTLRPADDLVVFAVFDVLAHDGQAVIGRQWRSVRRCLVIYYLMQGKRSTTCSISMPSMAAACIGKPLRWVSKDWWRSGLDRRTDRVSVRRTG
jgi:hypothetical protein